MIHIYFAILLNTWFLLVPTHKALRTLKATTYFKCLQDKRYTVLQNCHKYGYCLNDTILLLNCPQNRIFNKETQTCMQPSDNAPDACVPKGQNICYEDSVLCHDKLSCVAPEDICNGVLDCYDGSDEKLDCKSLEGKFSQLIANEDCQGDEYKCATEGCIPISGRCNGLVDCSDWSDEFDCDIKLVAIGQEFVLPNVTSSSSSLTKSTTTIISRELNTQESYIRNFNINNTRKDNNCNDKYWSCDSFSECIPIHSLCNGIANCKDGSDEIHCDGNTRDSCESEECRYPHCRCASSDLPPNVKIENMPQIIMITFDDGVRAHDFKNIYNKIFNNARKNPNGCPIRATFFVSNDYTDYSRLNQLYRMGHEIASHSISHKLPESYWNTASYDEWRSEIAGQKEFIHRLANIPKNDMKGMRAPYLRMGGNTMFSMLVKENFIYDSSWVVQDINPPLFPFTLDFPKDLNCLIEKCPNKSFPGVWEVPLLYFQALNRDELGGEEKNNGVLKMIKSGKKILKKKKRSSVDYSIFDILSNDDESQSTIDYEGSEKTLSKDKNSEPYLLNDYDFHYINENSDKSNKGNQGSLINMEERNTELDNFHFSSYQNKYINELNTSKNFRSCAMVDACPQPKTARGVFDDMKFNFERHYYSNKAPLPLFFHSTYFQAKHAVTGFIKFLDFALNHKEKDVWVVPISNTLEWMKSGGVPLTKLSDFEPFKCDNIKYRMDYNTCPKPRKCKYQIKKPTWTEERYVVVCSKRCPRLYPSINTAPF
ncbi:unnamed protein product [Gordionus sp. m RMFG-2023]|uniref:uncharacterized protein LOC135923834 n=1 Tax=Gordionus sp. m RMFG-2023 TaxID=3053472 RepID=UPI0030E54A13